MANDNNCPACNGQGWIIGLDSPTWTCPACLGLRNRSVTGICFENPPTLKNGDTLSITFTLEIPA